MHPSPGTSLGGIIPTDAKAPGRSHQPCGGYRGNSIPINGSERLAATSGQGKYGSGHAAYAAASLLHAGTDNFVFAGQS